MMTNNHSPADSFARRKISLPLIACLALAAPMASANWRVSPQLELGIEHDDNTTIDDTTGASNSDVGYGFNALATFDYESQLTEFSLTPRLRAKRYQDQDDLDSNDQFLDFDFRHERQKSMFRFRGNYSSESIRTAERSNVDFDIEDPDEIPDDDTGQVIDTGKRDRLKLMPRFTFDLTERATFGIGGSYLDTDYDDDVSQFLTGFSDYNLNTSVGYSWTQRDTISLIVSTGEYEVDSSGASFRSNGISVGYNRQLSERTRFRLTVGSDSSEDASGDDQTNTVGEVSLIRLYSTSRFIASLQRSVSGGGGGGLAIRDSLSLNISRDVTPKWTISGGVRAYQTDALASSNVGFVDRDYLQIRLASRWYLSRKFSVDLDYRYTDIDRGVVAVNQSTGTSNLISLWLNWHPRYVPE